MTDIDLDDIIVIDGTTYRRRWRATRRYVGRDQRIPGSFATETEAVEAAHHAGGPGAIHAASQWEPV